jgi:UDP-N-acetylglucosamine acyltransferase
MFVHESAIVSKKAKIGKDVYIGPFCIVEDNVEIGDGTKLDGHVVISGNTKIGKNNKISPFASIGKAPQDLKYDGEDTKVIIGNDNIIREYVTINSGTIQGRGETKIGNNNMFMALSHVAHDCIVGSNIVMANAVALAGYVILEDNVVLGGYTGVTQFNTVGKHAFIGAYSLIKSDFPPFMTGKGLECIKVKSVNAVGLSRRGFKKETVEALKEAYKIIYLRNNNTREKVTNDLSLMAKNDKQIEYLLNFIKNSKNIKIN